MTPPEHDIEYLEIDDIRRLSTLPGRFDLVVISSFSAQILEAYELADRYRSRGVTVVLGGLHVTALPDEAARHACAVVIGEGEPIWRMLIDDWAAGRLQPRYVVSFRQACNSVRGPGAQPGRGPLSRGGNAGNMCGCGGG